MFVLSDYCEILTVSWSQNGINTSQYHSQHPVPSHMPQRRTLPWPLPPAQSARKEGNQRKTRLSLRCENKSLSADFFFDQKGRLRPAAKLTLENENSRVSAFLHGQYIHIVYNIDNIIFSWKVFVFLNAQHAKMSLFESSMSQRCKCPFSIAPISQADILGRMCHKENPWDD